MTFCSEFSRQENQKKKKILQKLKSKLIYFIKTHLYNNLFCTSWKMKCFICNMRKPLDHWRFFDIYLFFISYILILFTFIIYGVLIYFMHDILKKKNYTMHIYAITCIILYFNYEILHENFIHHCIISWSWNA